MKLRWAASDRRVGQESVLTIRVEADDNNVKRIVLEDEFDFAGRDAVNEAIRRVDGAPAKIVIDLTGLRFIDPGGIACLVRAAERSGEKLEIIPGPDPVMRVFEIAGLVDLLPFREPAPLPVDGRPS